MSLPSRIDTGFLSKMSPIKGKIGEATHEMQEKTLKRAHLQERHTLAFSFLVFFPTQKFEDTRKHAIAYKDHH